MSALEFIKRQLNCKKSPAKEITNAIFGKSWHESLSPLIWRIPIFLWALATTTWSMACFWGPLEKYFLYMTHCGLLLIVLESAFGILVAAIKVPEKDLDATYGLPWYVKVYWVLYNITIPVAFLITVFYWCILRNSTRKRDYAPNKVLDVMIHGINSVVMMVELIFSAHPSRLLHIIQPLSFAGVYMLFTVVYYYAGGKDPWGNSFIYPVVDWSKPEKTILVIALTALFLALMHLLTVTIAALRDLFANQCIKQDIVGYDDPYANCQGCQYT